MTEVYVLLVVDDGEPELLASFGDRDSAFELAEEIVLFEYCDGDEDRMGFVDWEIRPAPYRC